MNNPSRWEVFGRIQMLSVDATQKPGGLRRLFMRIGTGPNGKIALTIPDEAAARFRVGQFVTVVIEDRPGEVDDGGLSERDRHSQHWELGSASGRRGQNRAEGATEPRGDGQ